jgi:hypothetical protein
MKKSLEDDQRDQKELIDCIHNLMGIFDTPMARRFIASDMAEEARKIGREIMAKYDRHSWAEKHGET